MKPPVISGPELCGETLENVNTSNGKIIQSMTRVAVLPIISCLIANTAIINNTTYVPDLRDIESTVDGSYAEFAKIPKKFFK